MINLSSWNLRAVIESSLHLSQYKFYVRPLNVTYQVYLNVILKILVIACIFDQIIIF